MFNLYNHGGGSRGGGGGGGGGGTQDHHSINLTNKNILKNEKIKKED